MGQPKKITVKYIASSNKANVTKGKVDDEAVKQKLEQVDDSCPFC